MCEGVKVLYIMIVGIDKNKLPVYLSSSTEKIPSKLKTDGYDTSDFGIPIYINNSGVISGTLTYADENVPVYWVNKNEKPRPLSLKDPNGVEAKFGKVGKVEGINDLGEIIGIIYYDGPDGPIDGLTSVYWPAYDRDPIFLSLYDAIGDSYEINSINNSREIVGVYDSVSPLYWPSYQAETPTILKGFDGLPCNDGEAVSINNSGLIVGYISDGPVYWLNKDEIPKRLSLKGPGGASCINNLGVIIGSNNDGETVYWSSYKDENPTYLGLIDIIPMDINDSFISTTTTKYVPPTTTTIAAPTTTTVAAPTTTYVPPTTITIVAPTTTTTTSPPVISNICFPAGTLITTDQGPVAIERLDTTKHSIAGDPILHVVKTIVLDKYLICFPKHSIKQHMPTQETLISKEHKIFYQNKFLKASQFLDLCPEVKKVKYNGECLYNVLLAKYTTMQVNNITCETLHPKNMIAKLYLKNFTEFGRNQIILQINKSLVSNNEAMYQSVTKHLT